MSYRRKLGCVLFFLTVCFCSVLASHFFQSRVEKVPPLDLYRVIYRQVNAMKEDNFSDAYGQVSGKFQAKFNLPQFIGVVRSDYAGISKSVRVEFGAVESRGDQAMLTVYFINRRGQVTPCIYTLSHEGAAWKIDNAEVMQSWPAENRIAGLRI